LEHPQAPEEEARGAEKLSSLMDGNITTKHQFTADVSFIMGLVWQFTFHGSNLIQIVDP
jgi:hypothetical protein